MFLVEQQDLTGRATLSAGAGEEGGEEAEVETEQRHLPPLRQLQGLRS